MFMYKSIHVRKYALIANRLLLNYKAASQFNIYLYALIFKVIGIKPEKFPILIQKLY